MNRNSHRILITAIFLLVSVVVFAQKQRPMNKSWYDDKLLHFGFSLGFNAMDFRVTPDFDSYIADSLYPEVALLSPGINIQIVVDYRPAQYWDIRFLPGVSFGQRNVMFFKNQEIYDDQQKIESSFLEFPLLLKYKGMRLNNVRPYLISGLNYRVDLAGRKDYDEEEPIYIRLKRNDLYLEAGAGMDFYLPYFKLSIELKMSSGLRDILVHDPAPGYPQYANAIEKVRSQIWVLSFHFE